MRATLATAGFLTVVIVAASPLAAAGPSPLAAAGPSPLGAAGPSPLAAAAGPSPLAAAGPSPLAAAGPSPLAAAAPWPVAVAAASPLAAAGPSPASVRTVRCSIARREAAFHARMQRLAGAERMAMRFTLLERGGAGGFAPVKVPGLRRWHRSRPGVSAFGYRQGVRNLMENAVYRMRVDFRWFSAEGELIRSMRRRSSPCRQYAALPNLRAKVRGQTPSAVPGVVRYLVRLKNDGNAAASDASVALAVDGDVVDTIGGITLAAGERRTVAIRGPECDRAVEVRADPDDTIAESSEEDNADAVDCDDLAVG
jgi:CARDB